MQQNNPYSYVTLFRGLKYSFSVSKVLFCEILKNWLHFVKIFRLNYQSYVPFFYFEPIDKQNYGDKSLNTILINPQEKKWVKRFQKG